MKLLKYTWLIVGLALMMTSCKSYVEDINDDPNNATDAPLNAVLNAAMTSMIIAHEGEDARLSCMWNRQFTGSDRQYSAYNVYNLNAEDFSWDKYYIAIQNAQEALVKAQEINDGFAQGVCQIMRAHSMSTVAALWGDCPFNEANQFPDITDPVFDGQTDVYNSCLSLLDDAIANIGSTPSSVTVTAVDHYYGGDASKWTKLAHSLKARIHLHLGNSSEAISSATNGIVADEDSWLIPHTGGANLQDQNIWYSFGQINREGYLTAEGAYLPTLLDPNSSDYRGNSKTDESARFEHIYTGADGAYDLNYEGMWAATASYPLFLAVENHLIIAESQLNQSNMGEALNFLNSARAIVAAQFPSGNYAAYEMADFESGGMLNNGNSTEGAMRNEIILEKYVSLVGQIESFNDMRRTDNLLGISPTQGGALPERFLIPQGEIDANSNVPNPIPDLFQETPVNQ